MSGKRNSNWKRILTGWLFALLLFGTIEVRPELPLASTDGAAAQVAEGQEGLDDGAEAWLCVEVEEEWTKKD